MKKIILLVINLVIFNFLCYSATIKIISCVPSGILTDVSQAKKIVIVFSEPVINLSEVKNISKPDFLKMIPEIKADYYWASTNTFTIVAKNKFKLSRKYLIIIKKRLSSTKKLDKEYKFSFITPLLKLKNYYPYNNSNNVSRKKVIKLWFNREIPDINYLKKYINISISQYKVKKNNYYKFNIPNYREDQTKYKLYYEYLRSTKKYNKKCIEIHPMNLWPEQNIITVKLLKNAKIHSNDQGIFSTVSFKFKTEPSFNVIKLKNNIIEPENYISVRFTTPVNKVDIEKNIKVFEINKNKLKNIKLKKFSKYNDSTKYYSLNNYHFKPEKEYKIYVSGKLKDIYNSQLSYNFQQTIKIGNYQAKLYSPAYETVSDTNRPAFINLWTRNIISSKVKIYKLDEKQLIDHFIHNKEPDKFKEKIFRLNNNKNKLILKSINISNIVSKKNSSIYFFQFNKAKTFPLSNYYNEDLKTSLLYQYSPFEILFKQSEKSFFIDVKFVKNKKPVKFAKFRIYNEKGLIISKGITNSKGNFRGKFTKNNDIYSKKIIWVEHKKYSGYITSNWDEGIEPYQFGLYEDSSFTNKLSCALYIDKNIYLPKDKINFAVIIRKKENNKILSYKKKILVELISPTNNIIDTKECSLNEYSSVYNSFNIPKNSKLGQYSLVVKNENNNIIKSVYFKVGEFIRPVFNICTKLDKKNIVIKDSSEINISALYYNGGKLKNSNIDILFSIYPFDFKIRSEKYLNYQFTDKSFNGSYRNIYINKKIKNINGKTDNNGKFNTFFSIDHLPYCYPYKLNMELNIKDNANEQLTKKLSLYLHPADHYIGIEKMPYFCELNKQYNLNIIALNIHKKKIDKFRANLKLYRRVYNTIKTKLSDGRYENISRQEDILEKEYNIEKADKISIILKKPGYYILKAESKDKKGRIAKSSIDFYCAGKDYVPWERKNKDIINIVFDKKIYKPGDIAKIIVKSPYKKAKVLISVEKKDIIDVIETDLSSSGEYIKLPIKSEYFPLVYVNVFLRSDNKSEIYSYRTGYKKIIVSPTFKKLKLSVNSLKKVYSPSEIAEFKIKVKSNSKISKKYSVLLWAVDKSLIDMTGFKLKDPLKQIYPEDELGVLTSFSMLKMQGFRHFGKKGDNSGGGGGTSLSQNLKYIRDNFNSTAFFKIIETDNNGEKILNLKLPDNLTEYKLFAVAFSKYEKFGSFSTNFKIEKFVSINTNFPKFSRYNDEFTGYITVLNKSGKNGELIVNLKDISGIKCDNKKFKIFLNNTDSYTFKVKCHTLSSIKKIKFNILAVLRVSNNIHKDEISVNIPVYNYKYRNYSICNGVLNTMKKEIIKIDDNIKEPKLEIMLNSSEIKDINNYFNILKNYPYLCLEQRTSKLYPYIMFPKLLKELSINKLSSKKIDEYIEFVLNCQNNNGGLSYWPNSKWSSVYLSSYVLEILNRLSQTKNILKIKKGLKKYFNNILLTEKNILISKRLTELVYSIYSLKLLNDNRVISYSDNIFKNRNYLSLNTKILFYSILENNYMKEILWNEIQNNFQINSNSITLNGFENNVFYHESLIKSYSDIICEMIKDNKDEHFIQKLIKGLYRSINFKYLTTNNTVSVLKALNSYYLNFSTKFKPSLIEIYLSKQKLLTKNIKNKNISISRIFKEDKLNALFKNNKKLELLMKASSKTQLYYNCKLSYYSDKANKKSIDHGFSIKTYFNNNKFKVGGNKILTIEIENDANRNFVVAEIPIAAGMRFVDNSFLTSVSLKRKLNRSSSFIRKEKKYNKLILFADKLKKGKHYYEIGVILSNPGKFNVPQAKIFEMYEPQNFGMSKVKNIIINN